MYICKSHIKSHYGGITLDFPKLNIKKLKSWPTLETTAETQTATRFLEAVSINPESAWPFVSKVCAASLDLNDLHAVLYGANITTGNRLCSRVVTMPYAKIPQNCQTRSILIEDIENKLWLLHLRMIKEPDRYSTWKIINVDKTPLPKLPLAGKKSQALVRFLTANS